MENEDALAYSRICKYLKKLNCSGVLWHQHFGKVFVICSSSKLSVGKIYNAIFDSFYDVIGSNANIINRFQLNPNCCSFSEIAISLDLNYSI